MDAFKLRDYQKAAVEKLHTGAILVGGVGSGKTITALSYFFSKICGGKHPALGDLRYSPEIKKTPLYVITTARKRDSLDWQKEAGVYLLEPIVDSWNNIQKYVGTEKSFFIFDEQRVVGSGKWVKSFLKIAKRNQWILLSATPGDTWLDYIPVMIANGYYNSRREFLIRHVVFNHFSKFPKVDHYVEINRLIRIRREIVVNMHFVRKTERHYHDVVCEHDRSKVRMLYEDRWNIFENRPIKDAGELCLTLRKVVNSDFSRVEKLLGIFRKHRKVIVFYNFDYELRILEETAEKSGIPYSQWNGHKHEELLRDKSEWMYFCQYTAASEAWNAIETDTVIFFSLNYSYKIMEQSSGRIDRMNTSFSDLHYYRLISNSIIDKMILRALTSKQMFQESAFEKTLLTQIRSQEKHTL